MLVTLSSDRPSYIVWRLHGSEVKDAFGCSKVIHYYSRSTPSTVFGEGKPPNLARLGFDAVYVLEYMKVPFSNRCEAGNFQSDIIIK